MRGRSAQVHERSTRGEASDVGPAAERGVAFAVLAGVCVMEMSARPDVPLLLE